MSSLSVLAFDASGNLIVQRNFTASEIEAKKATFALPESSSGTTVSFYAIANATLGSITTKAELLSLVENSAADYNGPFAEVSAKCKRNGGFLMTGSQSREIAAAGASTDVTIALQRTVAKVAVRTSLSSDFASKYPGKVRINTAAISKAASRTPYFGGTAAPGAMTFGYTQPSGESSGTYSNLFYLFENGPLAAGSRVLLTLDGIYDRDGNFGTTDDQTPVTYTVELTGTANGQLLRNGYYRIAIDVSGLTGQDVTATVTVADWQTPVTQTVSLGQ